MSMHSYLSNVNLRKPNKTMRPVMTCFIGLVFVFFLGVSFSTLSLSKINIKATLLSSFDLTYNEDRYSGLSTQALLNVWSSLKGRKVGPSRKQSINETAIWVKTNPRGAERLPPSFIHSESDFYLHRLWGNPDEDLTHTPKYLVTFTVGFDQRANIEACVKKRTSQFCFSIMMGEKVNGMILSGQSGLYISAAKQTKWWFAKRFLHPDIVAPYDYIFIWDEDLRVEHFNAEEYLKLVRKHQLEISQPALEPNNGLTWQMTKRREESEVHKITEEKPGWCEDPLLPPCAAYRFHPEPLFLCSSKKSNLWVISSIDETTVILDRFIEIMAPVFSRNAWRCVWNMIQNDLVHGWGLDFALRKCVKIAHEKIGVIDSQWIVHQSVPSLGNQGQSENGKAPWEGVRERCKSEWAMFRQRMEDAEKRYYELLGYTYSAH